MHAFGSGGSICHLGKPGCRAEPREMRSLLPEVAEGELNHQELPLQRFLSGSSARWHVSRLGRCSNKELGYNWPRIMGVYVMGTPGLGARLGGGSGSWARLAAHGPWLLGTPMHRSLQL